MTQLFNPHTMETQVDGVRPKRAKATVADVVASKDGYVGFAVVNRLQHWLRLLRHDRPAATGPTTATLDSVVGRTERCDELNPVIRAWTTERTTAEIVELADADAHPVHRGRQRRDDPARWTTSPSTGSTTTNPDGGFLQPAAAVPHAPADPRRRRGPRRPRRSVRRSATVDRPTAARAGARRAPAGTRPFEGLRVADFTSFWAGPFLAHTLGHVRRRRDPRRVDGPARRRPADEPAPARPMPQWWERSPYFHATNTNKRGVTLDMSRRRGPGAGPAAGRRVRRDRRELQPAGDGRRAGLSWDDVRAVDPTAIMVRMPAFGLSRAVARPHRVRHDDGAGVGHGLAQPGSPSTRRARCSGRATRAPGCTR